jgi:hypothetical protein
VAVLDQCGYVAGNGQVLLALLKNAGVPVVRFLLGRELEVGCPRGRRIRRRNRLVRLAELLTFPLELGGARLLPLLKFFDPV